MRLRVDREVCVGAGMCALTAPAVFDQDDEDGRVVVLDPAAAAQDPAVREAARVCPSGAVSITPDH